MFFQGQRTQELLQAHGLALAHEWVDPARSGAPAGSQTGTAWPPLPHIREVPVHWQNFDAEGQLWGLGGHFPLLFMLGDVRTHSVASVELRRLARSKVTQWRSSSVWPWWWFHESEKQYWLPGDVHSGRGFSGPVVWGR
jgi:hypothetical protein